MSMDPTTQIRLLGRCGSCDYAASALPEQAQTADRYRDMDEPGVPYAMGAQYYVRCPQSHRPFKLYRVEGEYSDKFECDARCENARGYECKCSCGGMNHGKSWAIQPSEVTVHHAGITTRERLTDRYDDPRAQQTIAERVLDDEAQVQGEPKTPRQVAPPRKTKTTLDFEVGATIAATGKVIAKKDTSDATLFVLVVDLPENLEAIVKSFVPSYAVEKFDCEVGDIVDFKAKVKKHEDHPDFGPSTMVTYLETV